MVYGFIITAGFEMLLCKDKNIVGQFRRLRVLRQYGLWSRFLSQILYQKMLMEFPYSPYLEPLQSK